MKQKHNWSRSSQEIDYDPYPKQLEAHFSPAMFRLYGGARGGGKTVWLVMEAVRQGRLLHHGRGVIFRRNYPQLERYIIDEFRKRIPPHVAIYQDHYKKAIFFDKKGNPWSELFFCHCEDDRDLQNHWGMEYDYIGVDELEEMNFPAFWDMVLGCLRSTNPAHKELGTRPNFFATAMPASIEGKSGVGALDFIKSHWIDRTADYGAIDKDEFWFMQALVDDNPRLVESNPHYIQFLESLSPKYREAWRYGKWDVFSGQFFTPFRRDFHVIPDLPTHHWTSWNRPAGINPDTSLPPEARLHPFNHCFVTIDYGFHDPTVAHWWGVDETKNLWIYREYRGQGILARDNARAIAHLTTPGERSIMRKVVIDPSAFSRHGVTWDSPGDDIQKELRGQWGRCVVESLERALNERVMGWQLCLRHLGSDGTQYPRVFIAECCMELIKGLESATHSQRHPEEVTEGPWDHALDSFRYGIMSRGEPIKHKGEVYPPGTLGWRMQQDIKKAKRKRQAYIGHDRLKRGAV